MTASCGISCYVHLPRIETIVKQLKKRIGHSLNALNSKSPSSVHLQKFVSHLQAKNSKKR